MIPATQAAHSRTAPACISQKSKRPMARAAGCECWKFESGMHGYAYCMIAWCTYAMGSESNQDRIRALSVHEFNPSCIYACMHSIFKLMTIDRKSCSQLKQILQYPNSLSSSFIPWMAVSHRPWLRLDCGQFFLKAWPGQRDAWLIMYMLKEDRPMDYMITIHLWFYDHQGSWQDMNIIDYLWVPWYISNYMLFSLIHALIDFPYICGEFHAFML